MAKKYPPIVRKKNGYYVIDRGPHAASPVLHTKEAAERLLQLEEKWHGKPVFFYHKGMRVIGRVTNEALSYEDHNGMGPCEKLAVRYDGSTYWVYAANVEEV